MTGISNYMSAFKKMNKLFTCDVNVCSLKLLHGIYDVIFHHTVANLDNGYTAQQNEMGNMYVYKGV